MRMVLVFGLRFPYSVVMALDAIIGIAAWAFIGYLAYKLIRKAMGKAGATANASAEATGEGGEALSGAHADVGGIHLHIHIGDGISVSRSDDPDGSFAINPAELLRSGAIDGGGIRSLPNGERNFVDEGGNSAGVLPAPTPYRRRRGNQHLAVGE